MCQQRESGDVAFLPDGSRAFVPSESAGLLHVIDTDAHKVIKTLRLPQGSRPMGSAVSRDGRKLYVGAGRAGTVCDTSTFEISTIKAGPRPWGVAIAPAGKFLYVANGPSNDVSVVDVGTEKEVARIRAGESPWGVTIVPAGR